MGLNLKYNFKYRVENNGITITGYKIGVINKLYRFFCTTIAGYNLNEKDIVIPKEIKGLPVVAIGVSAFWANQLTNVIIPDSVKIIEEKAFWRNKLTNVIIPGSVKEIGYEAFRYNQLTEVVIPKSVKEVENNAFDDHVKIIRKYLFFKKFRKIICKIKQCKS